MAEHSNCDVSRVEHLTLASCVDSFRLINAFRKMPKLQKLEMVYSGGSDWISVCEAVQAKRLKSFKCAGEWFC